MDKVSLLARLVVHEGQGDTLVAKLDAMFDQAAAEPGTELYVLNRSAKDPDVFWLYELYTDRDALRAHGSSEVMQATLAAFGSLVKETEMIVGAPVQAYGLALES
jgi:quinol monooxygenase YgiN